MNSSKIRIKLIFLMCVAASAALWLCARMTAGDASKPVQPAQASFQVKNEFKVQVPKGAKSVRIWFAVPQEDAASVVREFTDPVLPRRLGKPRGICGSERASRWLDQHSGRVWPDAY
jgi:hypothetical protein